LVGQRNGRAPVERIAAEMRAMYRNLKPWVSVGAGRASGRGGKPPASVDMCSIWCRNWPCAMTSALGLGSSLRGLSRRLLARFGGVSAALAGAPFVGQPAITRRRVERLRGRREDFPLTPPSAVRGSGFLRAKDPHAPWVPCLPGRGEPPGPARVRRGGPADPAGRGWRGRHNGRGRLEWAVRDGCAGDRGFVIEPDMSHKRSFEQHGAKAIGATRNRGF